MAPPPVELDAVGLLFSPLAYVFGGALVLLVLNNVLRGLAAISAASFAKHSEYHRTVQQVASKYLKPIAANLFGADGPVGVKLEHVLLAAILVVLVGMWRTSFAQAELARRESRAAAKAAAAMVAAGAKKGEGKKTE